MTSMGINAHSVNVSAPAPLIHLNIRVFSSRRRSWEAENLEAPVVQSRRAYIGALSHLGDREDDQKKWVEEHIDAVVGRDRQCGRASNYGKGLYGR